MSSLFDLDVTIFFISAKRSKWTLLWSVGSLFRKFFFKKNFVLRFILYISVYLCYPRWEFWGVSVPFRNVEGSPVRLYFFIFCLIRSSRRTRQLFVFCHVVSYEPSRVSCPILNIITQLTTRKKNVSMVHRTARPWSSDFQVKPCQPQVLHPLFLTHIEAFATHWLFAYIVCMVSIVACRLRSCFC
jgi:hypothetical protein